MNAPLKMSPTPPTLVAQIAGLPDLPMADIKALWQRLFRSETPTHNRQFLERRIAYKLQEVEFRKDNPNRALLERNQRRITALIDHGKLRQCQRDSQPVPGTVLTRDYRGVIYRIVVTADGQYDWDGRLYASLSMIAREITGTRWSGPLFFGLKAPSKPTAKSKKKGRK